MKSKTVTYKVQKPEPTTQRVDLRFEVPVGSTVLIDGGAIVTVERRSRLFRSEVVSANCRPLLLLLTARVAPPAEND